MVHINYMFQYKLCSTHYSTHNIGEISCPICTYNKYFPDVNTCTKCQRECAAVKKKSA